MVPALHKRVARRVALTAIAAAIVCAGGGNQPGGYFSKTVTVFAVSAASAGDRGGGGDRDNGGGFSGGGGANGGDRGGGDNGGGFPGGGGANGGGGDNGGGSPGGGGAANSGGGSSGAGAANGGGDSGHHGGGFATRTVTLPGYVSGSSGTSVGYDAGRHMMQLHVPLSLGSRGSGKEFDPGHHTSRGHATGSGSAAEHASHWNFLNSLRHKDGSSLVNLASLEEGRFHHTDALGLLDKSVNPTVERFHRAFTMAPSKATSIMTKTSLGIGGLSFNPHEILGIDLDEASLQRATDLGFTKSQQTGSGSAHIVRLLVPPNYDAIRAQEQLSKEMPGHRFELNKVYRLYRAAMRDGLEAPRLGAPAPASPACPAERCFARDVIQWQDQLSACAKGLRIGVIDTEIDIGHPTFRARSSHIHTNSFVPENRPAAEDWHGTGVLALLAGDPASGTPGLVPDAEFFTAGIFFSEDNGGMATDTVSLMSALAWMKQNDVQLINMSFAGPKDDLVRDEIEDLRAHGITLVAAAGNEGPAAEPAYPAAYPEVIAVTAITKDLRNYRYANRGEHIDVAAPGVDIWTAVPGAREGYHSGTSFAAPHVTGILALLPRESLARNKNEILNDIPVVDLGPPGRDPVYGRGLLVAPPSCNSPSETVASLPQ